MNAANFVEPASVVEGQLDPGRRSATKENVGIEEQGHGPRNSSSSCSFMARSKSELIQILPLASPRDDDFLPQCDALEELGELLFRLADVDGHTTNVPGGAQRRPVRAGQLERSVYTLGTLPRLRTTMR